MKEFLKLLAILVLFLGVAPLGGIWLHARPKALRIVFGVMCFMTIGGLLGPAEWGLTLNSVETYRGHAKGFHFYLVEMLALMLIVAMRKRDPLTFRWMPPGLWLYLLYCGLSMLSLVGTPRPDYVWMAGVKSVKMSLLLIASFNFLRSEESMAFFLRVMALTLLWELFAVLKLKYLNGIYQVRGTFEHQNSLAMYATMMGMVLLSAGMGPRMPGANLLLGGFLASAAIVQSTLSRAGLVIFALGTVAVVVCSLLDQPTRRRIATVSVLGFIGSLGLILTIGTILARFNDQGNQASGETRELMNAAAKEMVRDHPLGIGWNNYAHTINAPFPYGDIIDEWEHERGHKVDPDYAKGVVESHYYLLLSETGWQGLFSYLLFISVFLWMGLRGFLYFRRHPLGCISLGIAVGCICNYLQSTLERVLTQPRNIMLWMLLLGLAARIETSRREQKAAGGPL